MQVDAPHGRGFDCGQAMILTAPHRFRRAAACKGRLPRPLVSQRSAERSHGAEIPTRDVK